MILYHLLIFLAWVAYCFLHSLFANDGIKKWIIAYLSWDAQQYRLFYNIFALVSLILIIYFQINTYSLQIFAPSTILFIAALFLGLLGMIIMGICIKGYFRQMSGLEKRQPTLVTKGLHQFVRHPLYLGTIIFLNGVVLFFPTLSNLLAFFVIVIYINIGMRIEEKKLLREFGEAYENYIRLVPRIVPFI